MKSLKNIPLFFLVLISFFPLFIYSSKSDLPELSDEDKALMETLGIMDIEPIKKSESLSDEDKALMQELGLTPPEPTIQTKEEETIDEFLARIEKETKEISEDANAAATKVADDAMKAFGEPGDMDSIMSEFAMKFEFLGMDLPLDLLPITQSVKEYIEPLKFEVTVTFGTKDFGEGITISGTVWTKDEKVAPEEVKDPVQEPEKIDKEEEENKKEVDTYTMITRADGTPLKMELIIIQKKKDSTHIITEQSETDKKINKKESDEPTDSDMILSIDLPETWRPSEFLPKFAQFDNLTFKNSTLIISTFEHDDKKTGKTIVPGANVTTTIEFDQLEKLEKIEPFLHKAIATIAQKKETPFTTAAAQKMTQTLTTEKLIEKARLTLTLVISDTPILKGAFSFKDIQAPHVDLNNFFNFSSLKIPQKIQTFFGTMAIKKPYINFEIGTSSKTGQKIKIGGIVNLFNKELHTQLALERKNKAKKENKKGACAISEDAFKFESKAPTKPDTLGETDQSKPVITKQPETDAIELQTEEEIDVGVEIEKTATLSVELEKASFSGSVPGFNRNLDTIIHEPRLTLSSHNYEARNLKKGLNFTSYIKLSDLPDNSIITKVKKVVGALADKLVISLVISSDVTPSTEKTNDGQSPQKSDKTEQAEGEQSPTQSGKTEENKSSLSLTDKDAEKKEKISKKLTQKGEREKENADFLNIFISEITKITSKQIEALLLNELEKTATELEQRSEVQTLKNILRKSKFTMSIPATENATVALYPDLINVDTLPIPDAFKKIVKNMVLTNPEFLIDVSTDIQRAIVRGNALINNKCIDVSLLLQRESGDSIGASLTFIITDNISETFTDLPLIAGINIKNGMLKISSFAGHDSDLNLDFEPGLTILAQATLSGKLFEPMTSFYAQKTGKQISEKKDETIKLKAVIKKDLAQSRFEAEIPKEMNISFAKIPGLREIISELHIGRPMVAITPGSQEIMGGAIISALLPFQDQPFETKGAIGFQPGATVVEFQIKKLKALFLDLKSAGIKAAITPLGVPIAIEVNSDMIINNKPIAFALKVGKDGNALTAKAEEMSLSAMVELFTKMTGVKMPMDKVPKLSLTDVDIHLVPIATTIAGKNIERGGKIKGKIAILGLTGELDCELSMSGIRCIGTLSTLELKDPLFNKTFYKLSGSGLDKIPGTTDDGPVIEIILTPEKQKIKIDGLIGIPILGISDAVFIEFSKDVGRFYIERKVGDDMFGMSVDGTASINNINSTQLEVALKQDFINVIKSELPKALNYFKGHISTLMGSMNRSIGSMNEKIGFLKNQLHESMNTEIQRVDNAIINANKRISDKQSECTNAPWTKKTYICPKITIESTPIAAELAGLYSYKNLLLRPGSFTLTAGSAAVAATNTVINTIQNNVGKLDMLKNTAQGAFNLMGNTVNTATSTLDINAVTFNMNMEDLRSAKLPKITVTGKVLGANFSIPMQINLEKPATMVHDLVTGLVHKVTSIIYAGAQYSKYIPGIGKLYPEKPTQEFEEVLESEQKTLQEIPLSPTAYYYMPLIQINPVYS